VAVLIFVVGLISGVALSSVFYNRWISTYMMNESVVGIGDRYSVLKEFQAGNTNETIRLLESQMNGEILEFAGIREDVPVAKLKPGEIRLIKLVRDYRAAHPYNDGDSDIDQTVSSILSLTNKTMWPAVETKP
jgi:hypothetical protein